MGKLFVKYSKDYPYLPEGVADTKTELAEVLGVRPNLVFSAFSRGISTYAEVEVDEESEDKKWQKLDHLKSL